MANAFLEALKRQKLTQMSHQPQPLPPDLLGMMSNAEGKLYDRSMIYKSLKDAVTAPMRAYRGEIDALMDPRGAMEEAMNTAGMAQLGGIPGGARGPGSVGMITYHGSPHKFDKFDMSKIGTGEGAQAYGHGLYLAESPGVAKYYADVLPLKNNPEPYSVKAADAIEETGNIDDAIRLLMSDAKSAKKNADVQLTTSKNSLLWSDGSGYGNDPIVQGLIDSNVSAARHLNRIKKNSNFYKVDIPDEAVARMLDWDKPLSEQALEVQKALQSNPNYEKYWMPHLENRFASRGENPSVGDLHNYLKDDYMPDEIAELFKSQGIPGIRYLDGGSRNAGQGTYNYVLFDDQLPRILERNGEATGLQPWQPGEANALLGIPSRPRNALGQNWNRPKLSDFGGDKLKLEEAQAAINEKMMLSFIDALKQNGINPESPGLSAGLGQEYTPWTNAIGGRSIYTHVPGYGTVRFSDHHAGATNTFATPEDAISAIKETFYIAAAKAKEAQEIRSMLGLVDEQGKANLQRINEYLAKNQQTGQAKDPGYWKAKAMLSPIKGDFSFQKLPSNPFTNSRPRNALGQEEANLYDYMSRE